MKNNGDGQLNDGQPTALSNQALGADKAADGVTPVLFGTVYDAFCRSVVQWPDNIFIDVPSQTASAYRIPSESISYARAKKTVDRWRGLYRNAGYGPGHRVGLLVENRPDFFWHWLALNSLGVSLVPINADFQVGEIAYLLENSEALLVVSLPERHERITQAAVNASLDVAVMAPDDEVPTALRPAPGSGDPDVATECALLYTSGTTGQPKGCILPNEYFLYGGVWYRDIGGYLSLQEGKERLLSPLPLVHMNAMATSSMVMLITGGTIVLLDRFHPSSWWHTVRESQASIVHYLGVMPAMLIGAPESEQDKDHQVRFGFGAGVDRRHHAAFEARFGFPLVEGWAMTETGAGGCIMATVDPRQVGTNSFGQPPAGVAWRLVNDQNEDAAVEEAGELLVRWAGSDPMFGYFKGYLKKAEATAQAWEGGWFHTGDLVRRDEAGHLHFVDRKKNVIRRSGENISAVEVEGVLMQHPAVFGVGVAPVPDPVRGDEVMACVVVGDGYAGSESLAREIADHCRASLAYYKAPGYVAFVPALPLTATQKVQRGGLRDLAQACVDGSGAQAATSCHDLRELKRRA
ncbi:MAG: AMP-binding protein [Burkholderiaceae bacterium]